MASESSSFEREIERDIYLSLFEGYGELVPKEPVFLPVMEERDAGRSPSVQVGAYWAVEGYRTIENMEFLGAVARLAEGRLADPEEGPSRVERAAAEALLYRLDELEREERG